MTHNDDIKTDTGDAEWEAELNALLDGELDPAAAEALKLAASEDHALARSIIEAYQLQRGMDQLGLEKAPASLRRKLKNIPRDQRRSITQPRWFTMTGLRVAAVAIVPLLVIGIVLMQPPQPSAAEVEQARQELALAFSYLDRINSRANEHMLNVLGTELRSGIRDNISEHIPYTKSSRKEKTI